VRVNDIAAELLRQALLLLELKPCDEDPLVQAALDHTAKTVAGLGAILAGHAAWALWKCCGNCGGSGRVADDLKCWECEGKGYLPPKAIPPMIAAAPSTPASTQPAETPPPEPPPAVPEGPGGG
jgi:hypothetical protein